MVSLHFCSIFINPVRSLHTQSPLSTGNLTLPTRNTTRSLPYRNRKRLKSTLSAVVIIVTPQAVHMERDSCRLGKTLQTMGDHLAAEVANLLALQTEVDHAIRSIGQVDNRAAEGLV